MKLLILSLEILLVSFQVSGQRKSKVDPKDATIDTLTNANKSLTLQLDLVSREPVKYVGVYDVIREKVIHYHHDPSMASFLIDSLKVLRDSTSSLLAAALKFTASADSIKILIRENTVLKDSVNIIKTAWHNEKTSVTQEKIDMTKILNNLRQLKELLDNKIITEAELNTLRKKYL